MPTILGISVRIVWVKPLGIMSNMYIGMDGGIQCTSYIQGRSEKVKAWQEAFMYSKEMYVEYSVE